MQECFGYFIGVLVVLGATLMLAFPEHLIPELKGRKKRFTARHWGAYHDSKDMPAEATDEDGIDAFEPAKKIRHVVGSQTYAGGRGVRM